MEIRVLFPEERDIDLFIDKTVTCAKGGDILEVSDEQGAALLEQPDNYELASKPKARKSAARKAPARKAPARKPRAEKAAPEIVESDEASATAEPNGEELTDAD